MGISGSKGINDSEDVSFEAELPKGEFIIRRLRCFLDSLYVTDLNSKGAQLRYFMIYSLKVQNVWKQSSCVKPFLSKFVLKKCSLEYILPRRAVFRRVAHESCLDVKSCQNRDGSQFCSLSRRVLFN